MSEPPYWDVVDPKVPVGGPFTYGFSKLAKGADINRFRARYVFASSFIGVRCQGLSSSTEQGYSELTRVFAWWSTLELLKELCGKKDPSQLVEINGSSYCAEIRAIPNYEKFIFAAVEHVDRMELKEAVGNFLRGKNSQPLCISRTIRHIYLHGHLTPGAGGIDDGAKTSIALCGRSSEFLKEVVDSAWASRLKEAKVI